MADAVFDAGVLAVPQFQAGELTGDHAVECVGEESGDAVAVGVGEPQLGSGMGAFLAQDQPGTGRPGRQVDQVGGFGDPGALAEALSR